MNAGPAVLHLHNRSCPGLLDLREYIGIAQRLAELLAAGDRPGATLEQERAFAGIRTPEALASHQHFMIGLVRLTEGRVAEVRQGMESALQENPKNLYALSVLRDLMAFAGDEVPSAVEDRLRDLERWKGREDVVVFGDSHAHFCFSGIPRCRVHWLRETTMHRIGRDGLSALDIREYGVPEQATVVFCFGEIDVRCHIGKQADLRNCSLEEVVADLVGRYEASILANTRVSSVARVAVSSVVPPTSLHYDPTFPCYGTLEERISVTQALNRSLRDMTRKNGMSYIDLYAVFRNADGAMDERFRDGSVHVRKEFSHLVDACLQRAVPGLAQSG